MGDLTKNISRHEISCLCGCGYNIADYELMTVVQDATDFFLHRDRADKSKLIITSGNRCVEHNKSEGGAPNSFHLYGKAMDFIIETFKGNEWTRITSDDLGSYLDSKYPDKYGIIKYWSGRVHFDIRPNKYRAQK